MADTLEIQLHLRADTTIGGLRRFLSLIEEAPNDDPLLLIYEDDTEHLRAISALIQ